MICLSYSFRKFLFLFSLVFLHLFARSQYLQYSWANTVRGGDNSNRSVAVDPAGNVINCGYFKGTVTLGGDSLAGGTSFTSAGATDALLCKSDSTGKLIWAKRWGALYDDRCDDVITDAAGNVYVIGVFSTKISFDSITLTTPALDYNGFICKLDAAGKAVWAKQFGGVSSLYTNAYSINLDAANNLYVCGYYVGEIGFGPDSDTIPGANSPFAFVCKFDANGKYKWAQGFGSIGSTLAKDVTVDNAGNVYTIGTFTSMVDFNPDRKDSATVLPSSNSTATYISKLNANGQYVWIRAFLAPSNAAVRPCNIGLDAAGNIYTAGYFTSALFLDTSRNSRYLASYGSYDGWICKLDAAGNNVWAKQLGATTADEECLGMVVDAAGNVYTTGIFDGKASDFDPGTAKATFKTNGIKDVFFCKLDAAGNYAFAGAFGSKKNDHNSSMALDPAGNLYIAGHIYDTTDFDPGAGTAKFPANAQTAFVNKLINVSALPTTASLTRSGNQLQQVVTGYNSNISPVTVYPSPAKNNFTIKTTDKALLNTRAVLVNASGAPAKVITISDFATSVDISYLPAGMYILQLANGSSVKIIHQP